MQTTIKEGSKTVQTWVCNKCGDLCAEEDQYQQHLPTTRLGILSRNKLKVAHLCNPCRDWLIEHLNSMFKHPLQNSNKPGR